MKYSMVIHKEVVTRFFDSEGSDVLLSDMQKLQFEIFGIDGVFKEEKVYKTELEEISYRNGRECDLKFREVFEKFKNFLRYEDLIIE